MFRSDFSRVKLCDFGESRRASSSVQRRNEWLPYSPPEVLSTETDDTYKTDTSHDIWQFGIVVFICLTGCLPWQKAASDDPRYNRLVFFLTIKRSTKFKLFQIHPMAQLSTFIISNEAPTEAVQTDLCQSL